MTIKEIRFVRNTDKDYVEKAEISDCCWDPQIKLGVETHFSEIKLCCVKG